MSQSIDTATVLAEILNWLKSELPEGGAEIGPDTQVISEKLLDSMDLLRLVSFLEGRFELSLDPQQIVPENFATPASVAALVAQTAAS